MARALSPSKLVSTAVERVRAAVPAFANLKLVLELELTSGGLTEPARSERFRVELPGPKVSAGAAEDGRLTLTIPRPMFEILATEGELVDWKDAFYYGHLKVAGDERVKRLLGRAIDASG